MTLAHAPDWRPSLSFGMLREMARTFGAIVTRTRAGKTRYGLRFRIDGEEHFSWSVPIGSRWIAYRSHDLAEGVLDEIRGDVRRGIDPLAAVSPYIRASRLYQFGTFWDEWTTLQRERRDLGQISPHQYRAVAGYARNGYLDPILRVSVFALDYSHLEAVQQRLFARGLAPNTVKNCLANVRTCLRWLARRKGFPPAPEMPKTVASHHVPKIPSIEEQRALLDAIPAPARGYFLARALLGVRDEEAARANVEDYRRGPDESADSWRIRAKGGRDRLVPVPVELAAWVREYRPALSVAGVPLFTNPNALSADSRWRPSARHRQMQQAMIAIGRPGAWKPNEALRHCFGTRTAERLLGEGTAQVDVIRQIMAVMGHTSAASSMRYVQLGVEALRGVVK